MIECKVIHLKEVRRAREILGLPLSEPKIDYEPDFNKRTERIKKSLQKINKLMAELKEMSEQK